MVRRIEKVVVTPEIAKAWFEKRRESQKKRFNVLKARALLDSIKRHGYQEGNDLPMRDVEGFLSNGQHRMWVISEAGITVPLHVVLDAATDEFDRIDSHAARSMTFQLESRGLTRSSMVARVVKSSVEYVHNRFCVGEERYIPKRLTSSDIFNIFENSALLQSSRKYWNKPTQSIFGTNAGFYASVFETANQTAWESFYKKLVGDAAVDNHDVEWHLAAAINGTVIKGGKKLPPLRGTARAEAIIRAWNYRLERPNAKKFFLVVEESEFPTIAGVTPTLFAKNANLPINKDWVRYS